MPVFFIADVNITDPLGYEEYRNLVGETVIKYGGKFIAVTHRHIETLEGNWHPNHLVIIEFESHDQIKKWYSSPEYTHAQKIRLKTSTAQIVVME